MYNLRTMDALPPQKEMTSRTLKQHADLERGKNRKKLAFELRGDAMQAAAWKG
jgi:hypothetical protein